MGKWYGYGAVREFWFWARCTSSFYCGDGTNHIVNLLCCEGPRNLTGWCAGDLAACLSRSRYRNFYGGFAIEGDGSANFIEVSADIPRPLGRPQGRDHLPHSLLQRGTLGSSTTQRHSRCARQFWANVDFMERHCQSHQFSSITILRVIRSMICVVSAIVDTLIVTLNSSLTQTSGSYDVFLYLQPCGRSTEVTKYHTQAIVGRGRQSPLRD